MSSELQDAIAEMSKQVSVEPVPARKMGISDHQEAKQHLQDQVNVAHALLGLIQRPTEPVDKMLLCIHSMFTDKNNQQKKKAARAQTIKVARRAWRDAFPDEHKAFEAIRRLSSAGLIYVEHRTVGPARKGPKTLLHITPAGEARLKALGSA